MDWTGRYFFSPARRVSVGRYNLFELNTVATGKEYCPWCGCMRYSTKTNNCGECNTHPSAADDGWYWR